MRRGQGSDQGPRTRGRLGSRSKHGPLKLRLCPFGETNVETSPKGAFERGWPKARFEPLGDGPEDEETRVSTALSAGRFGQAPLWIHTPFEAPYCSGAGCLWRISASRVCKVLHVQPVGRRGAEFGLRPDSQGRRHNTPKKRVSSGKRASCSRMFFVASPSKARAGQKNGFVSRGLFKGPALRGTARGGHQARR
ncbi:hypothetical protein M885DRAFT_209567 [Pelagophyceae sp. CCMP2097]|nr:hypothetical protein M885DRAFT_209567 [Pelagophyceae sp. CCMP2097]